MNKNFASYRAYAWQLITEYAVVYVLLRLLDVDIDVRRQLEVMRKEPHDQKRSIQVERSREELQEDLRRLHAAIDAAFDLLAERGGGRSESAE